MSARESARKELTELAHWTCEQAVKAGAKEARAGVNRTRFTRLEYRDRKVDTLEESTEKGLDLTLYIEGKYSAHSTNDLRREALQGFVEETVAMTRYLTPDSYRSLPDPEYYAGRKAIELELIDDTYDAVRPEERHAFVREMEGAALDSGGDRIISVSAVYSDARSESAMVASNGFEGFDARTSFSCSASVTAKDEGDKRPSDYWAETRRRRGDLSDPATIGRRAVERALDRVGADKIPTEELPVIVENRTVRRLLRYFSTALSGRNLQQRQSFLEGKAGEQVTSAELTVIDDPFIARGRGSRLYDAEGLTARRLPIIEHGVIKNFYIDTYYGKKLDMPATTGSGSNTVFEPGSREPQSPADWMRELGRGILITSFIGGNSNSSTGDFSTGVQGFLFENGAISRPVSELNIAGNHLEFWHKLIGIGDDPYPFSSMRSPSLVFDRTVIAGA